VAQAKLHFILETRHSDPSVANASRTLGGQVTADVYFGRDKAFLKQRERIKRKTLEARRLHHRQQAA